MCKILMPINPKYVDKILSGKKKYEYRKTKAKRSNVDRMIIYATFPIMKVVAEVAIENIIEESPEVLWKMTKQSFGISKDFYNKYYKDKKNVIAYELGEIKKYEIPKSLNEIGINYIPQSFIYLD